jgi:hypothetical protein
VVAVAVQLDGQPLLRPAAVDVSATRRTVGDRERHALATEQSKEPPLEPAQRDVHVAAENTAQLRRAAANAQDRLHLTRRSSVSDSRFVTRTREFVNGEH